MRASALRSGGLLDLELLIETGEEQDAMDVGICVADGHGAACLLRRAENRDDEVEANRVDHRRRGQVEEDRSETDLALWRGEKVLEGSANLLRVRAEEIALHADRQVAGFSCH